MGVNSKKESVVVPFISSLSSSSLPLISVDQNRLGDICSLMDLLFPLCSKVRYEELPCSYGLALIM